MAWYFWGVKLGKQDFIDAGVRFIGIKGMSGSGKTTASLVMRDYFKKSILLPRDYYTMIALVNNTKLANKLFGRTFNNVQEAVEAVMRIESVDKFRKHITETIPEVEELIHHDLCSILNQNYTPNLIITEGIAYSAYDRIWGLATDKLTTIRAPKKRAKSLILREGRNTSPMRTAALFDLEQDGEQGTILTNNGKLISFEKKIIQFCKTIDVPSRTLVGGE